MVCFNLKNALFMKHNLVIVLFCSLFFASCVVEKNTVFQLLKHEVVALDSDLLLGQPMKMVCADGNLLILDAKSDAFFHWIQLPSLRYMGTYGERGQGPGEYLNIKSLHSINDTLYAYDFYKSELIRITPCQSRLEMEHVTRFPKGWTMELFPFHKNLFCGSGCFEEGMFHLLDSLGNVVYVSDDYPSRDEVEARLSNQIRFMAYQGCMVADGRGRFAYLTSQSKQCHIYELEHDSLKKITANIDSYPRYIPDKGDGFSVTHDTESPVGYRDGMVGEDCFYALYSGRTFKEYGMKSMECTILFSYDWDGRLLAAYELDMPVTTICLDKEHRCFYGIAYISDPTLIRFSLPTS